METVEKRVNPFSAKGKSPWNPRGKEGGFPHVFHGSPRFGRLGRAFGRSCQRPEKLFFPKFSLNGVFSCLFGGNNRQKPCQLLRIPVGFPRFHRLWKSEYGKPFSFCGKGFGNRFHIFSELFSTGAPEKKAAGSRLFRAVSECQKSGGAGGTASCRGYRGRAPNPCAAALSPQAPRTRTARRATAVRSPPRHVAGRKALFAGNSGQLGFFRQTEAVLSGRVFPPGKAVFSLKAVLCPLLIFQISSPASAWRPWLRFRRRLRFEGRRCRSWGASG